MRLFLVGTLLLAVACAAPVDMDSNVIDLKNEDVKEILRPDESKMGEGVGVKVETSKDPMQQKDQDRKQMDSDAKQDLDNRFLVPAYSAGTLGGGYRGIQGGQGAISSVGSVSHYSNFGHAGGFGFVIPPVPGPALGVPGPSPYFG